MTENTQKALSREDHDKAILFDLKVQLDDMDLVDEDKAARARENIETMVGTLLNRLGRATTRAPGEGEPVSWWVTHQQPGEPYKATRMQRVAEIWAEQGLEVTRLYAAPPSLAAPSYAQPAPRADLVTDEIAHKAWLTYCGTGGYGAQKMKAALVSAIGALSEAPREAEGWPKAPKFKFGERVTKTKGSSWTGLVCGFYSTALTLNGYCVESENEPGSVQLYPVAALSAAPKREG